MAAECRSGACDKPAKARGFAREFGVDQSHVSNIVNLKVRKAA